MGPSAAAAPAASVLKLQQKVSGGLQDPDSPASDASDEAMPDEGLSQIATFYRAQQRDQTKHRQLGGLVHPGEGTPNQVGVAADMTEAEQEVGDVCSLSQIPLGPRLRECGPHRPHGDGISETASGSAMHVHDGKPLSQLPLGPRVQQARKDGTACKHSSPFPSASPISDDIALERDAGGAGRPGANPSLPASKCDQDEVILQQRHAEFGDEQPEHGHADGVSDIQQHLGNPPGPHLGVGNQTAAGSLIKLQGLAADACGHPQHGTCEFHGAQDTTGIDPAHVREAIQALPPATTSENMQDESDRGQDPIRAPVRRFLTCLQAPGPSSGGSIQQARDADSQTVHAAGLPSNASAATAALDAAVPRSTDDRHMGPALAPTAEALQGTQSSKRQQPNSAALLSPVPSLMHAPSSNRLDAIMPVAECSMRNGAGVQGTQHGSASPDGKGPKEGVSCHHAAVHEVKSKPGDHASRIMDSPQHQEAATQDGHRKNHDIALEPSGRMAQMDVDRPARGISSDPHPSSQGGSATLATSSPPHQQPHEASDTGSAWSDGRAKLAAQAIGTNNRGASEGLLSSPATGKAQAMEPMTIPCRNDSLQQLEAVAIRELPVPGSGHSQADANLPVKASLLQAKVPMAAKPAKWRKASVEDVECSQQCSQPFIAPAEIAKVIPDLEPEEIMPPTFIYCIFIG